MESFQHDDKACGGDCGKCGLSSGDVERADRAGLNGWRMVVASGSSFLLPLVLAVVGAACLGPSGWAQALGAVGGLVLGGCLAAIVMRTFVVPLEEKP